MEISYYSILHALFVSRHFMTLTNSDDIWSMFMRSVLSVIKIQKSSSMFTSKTINRRWNILRSLISIVRSVHVWEQSSKMSLLLKRPCNNMSYEYIGRSSKTISPSWTSCWDSTLLNRSQYFNGIKLEKTSQIYSKWLKKAHLISTSNLYNIKISNSTLETFTQSCAKGLWTLVWHA